MGIDETVFEQCSQKLADNDYVVVDHFLTSEETANIQAGLQNKFTQNKFKQAGVGQSQENHKDAQIRGDWTYWIDSEKVFEIKKNFVPYIDNFVKYLNRNYFLSIKDYEMHYSVYPEKAYYKRHLDQLKGKNNRVLTFICYLNFKWGANDGGALRLYLNKSNEDERYVDIMPEAGRLVCFKSDVLEHEVLPTNRMRYSLSGWMLTRASKLLPI